MEKVNLPGGKVGAHMKESFLIIKFMGKVYLFLKIIGNMKEIGKIIK
jgi:hypothetical protein